MVLLGRIELPTSPLPRVRSTTELQQRSISSAAGSKAPPDRGAPLARTAHLVKRAGNRQAAGMSNSDSKSTREARLAANLRENLKRRKAQARALAGSGDGSGESPSDSAEDAAQAPALSKPEEDR